MALEKLKRGCPYGKEIAEEIEKGGNAGIETRLAALETMLATGIETRLAALETMFAAVLAAEGIDNGKTLQIDSNGKVALVTETILAALETRLAAVLAAEGTDNGKTLKIDSNGMVALVTV